MNSRPMELITLTLTGINSAAVRWATTVTSFFQFGPYTAAHMVSAVVVPEEKKECCWYVIISRHLIRISPLTKEGVSKGASFACLIEWSNERHDPER